jgi:hypothetical protein
MSTSEVRISRTVGVLLLLHLAVGLIAPFVILHAPLGPRGFLLDAAENALQLRLAVFLLIVGSAFAIAVAVAILPLVSRYSPPMAYWLVALAIAAFVLQVVDNGRLLSMLSLSQEYAGKGGANSELFQSLAFVVGSARKWTHFQYLLVAVSWIFLLFTVMFRFRLVPRVLAVFGMVTSLLQIIGVPLRVMMGYPAEMRMAMTLAPAYLALAVWLLIKGFDEGQYSEVTESKVAGFAERY